jgi:thioredoxin-related protein
MGKDNLYDQFCRLLKKRWLPFLLLCFVASSPVLAGEEITWHNLDSGIAAAKESHKMMLIDLYTEWCGYCKKLDQNTFTNTELINYLNDKFVCIKVNAEDSHLGKKINKEYKSTGYPCALVFDDRGDFLGQFEGYTNPSGYKMSLENVITKPAASGRLNLVSLMNGAENKDTTASKANLNTNNASFDNSQGDSNNATNIKHKLAPTIKSLIGRFY